MSRERMVLHGVQALILGLPLLLGGRPPWTLAVAMPLVLALLVITVRERRRCGAGPAPGVWALTAFLALGIATTVRIPPWLLETIAPATARLYADVLPGWPHEGGWSTWRPVAFDAYGVWFELSRIALAIGVFTVLVAYPWRETRDREDAAATIFGRLLLTVLAGGCLVAAGGLLGAFTGMGAAPWVGGGAYSGRMSGPFVNPNHFAAWLEMVIPVALAYAVAVVLRVRRRLAREAERGQGLGVRARRAWAAAMVAHQRRLSIPVLALGVVAVLTIAHRASGSRGGTAALLTGLAVMASGLVAQRLRAARPWLPGAVAVGVLAMGGMMLLRLAVAQGVQVDVDVIDDDLGNRLAASTQGLGVLRDHLLVGTGLGSWLDAFRLYQAPPIDGRVWDHAHNDYVELGGEVGLVGLALVLAFAGSVLMAATRHGNETLPERHRRPPGFEEPEWRTALRETQLLRWGLAGGIAASLVHSLVDFSLRMPANLVLAMALLALLALSGRRRLPETAGPSLMPLLLLTAVAAAPLAANAVLVVAGGTPLATPAALRHVDRLLSERSDASAAESTAWVRAIIDRAPVNREAHELLASIEAGPEGDVELRHAMRLQPSATELRNALIDRMWARGEHEAALAELESAVADVPDLATHVSHLVGAPRTDAEALRALLDGDDLPVQLSALDPEQAATLERGLERALEETPGGTERTAVVYELVALREARGRWREAAALLRVEADRSGDRGIDLGRAARDYRRAGELDAAEATLVAALLRAPDDGDLYRRLAVEVYAKRGDFETAERILRAAERNAGDMMAVYAGVTEVLRQQQQWLSSRAFAPAKTGGEPSAEAVP